jgi:eukaryotic-like serine/threonine-protein kinase
MNPDRWSLIKQIFSAAAELAPAERAAFIERETAGDAELLAEVKSLLAAHDPADAAFLGNVSPELRAAALGANDATLGERIGAYKLVEVIGTGGMGDVYKAVRDDAEYHAAVAIKLMRADVRNALAEQRFKTERQILAALDHRNIARLLDGGTTARGLPYVVMELVVGEPIDRYCDAHSLDTRERAQLFLQVCAAVSFAHQHLVVHRDLKPNNILVTADGSVKLLDFGIAKLLEPETITGTATEETRTQFRAMTLEFASPEQVSGGTVTTVSDVYSLGVVLYRLLTGQSPYRATGGDAARVAEILGDTTPTRPSAMATQERRNIDSDLDHVLLMALRKEPAKRYGSVEQFANDLRSYLNGHAVLARRGSLAYRARKIIRRYQWPIAAAAVIAISLVTALVVSIRETRIANEQRATAQRHFNSVRKLANDMVTKVFDEIRAAPGAQKARAVLAQSAREYLEELTDDAAGDPKLQLELAHAWRRLGETQGGMDAPSGGDTAAALVSFTKGIDLLEQILREDPANSAAQAGLVTGLISRTRVVLRSGDPQDGLAPALRAVEVAESIKTFRDDFQRAQIIGASLYLLADTYLPLKNYAKAMPLYDRVIAVSEEFTAKHPDQIEGLKLLRNAYYNAGVAIDPRATTERSFERTVALTRKALAMTDRLIALEPDSLEHKTVLAQMLGGMGSDFVGVRRYADALPLLRRAAPVLAKAAEDGADAHAQLVFAANEVELAGCLAKTGDATAAQKSFETADRSFTELLKIDANDVYANLFRAKLDIYRGEMFVELASQAKSADAKRDLRHRAQVSLAAGVTRMERLNQRYPLVGPDKLPWDAGIAALAALDGPQAGAR